MSISKQLFALAGAALALTASADVKINEVFRNPPGTDDTQEYIELKGTPGMSLNGYWILAIEGDGNSVGIIDNAIPLAGQSLGANGLFLLRDNVLVLAPNPDPATNVMVLDFNPDTENGSITYALVTDYTGYVINGNTNAGQNAPIGATDIDSDNNGILGDWGTVTAAGPVTTPGGVQPWTATIDALGTQEADIANPNIEYGSQMSGISLGLLVNSAATAFTPSALARSLNGVPLGLGFTSASASPGPYFINIAFSAAPTGCKVVLSDIDGAVFTPGSPNPAITVVVEPASYSIVQGTPFGGNLASLVASDDDWLFILNDESGPNAELQVTGSYCGTSASSVKAIAEASASRNDLSTFVDVRNAVTNAWTNAAFAVSSLTDVVISGTITANASNYIASNGNAMLRVRWIPTADLEAADGWSEQCDRAVLEIK